MNQRIGLEIERGKKDQILALLSDWDKEEEIDFKKLSWASSSWPDTLENRKYKHLTCLFELTYPLSISPADNVTQNPTGESELKFYGRYFFYCIS